MKGKKITKERIIEERRKFHLKEAEGTNVRKGKVN